MNDRVSSIRARNEKTDKEKDKERGNTERTKGQATWRKGTRSAHGDDGHEFGCHAELDSKTLLYMYRLRWL